jgi:hypothetical protein
MNGHNHDFVGCAGCYGPEDAALFAADQGHASFVYRGVDLAPTLSRGEGTLEPPGPRSLVPLSRSAELCWLGHSTQAGFAPWSAFGLALIVCLLVSLLAAPALPAELPIVATQPAGGNAPSVTVLDLSGRTFRGKPVQLDIPGGIRLDVAGKLLEIPAGQLAWLGFDLRPRAAANVVQWFSDPPVPIREKPKPIIHVYLELRDGQELWGPLHDAAKPDSLAIEHRLLGNLDLPFAQLKEIRIQSGAENPPTARALAATRPSSFDVLWLANGDRIEGILRSLGGEQASVELASGQIVKMPSASVRVIGLTEVASPASGPSSRAAAAAWLHLRGGERVVSAKIGWDAQKAAITFAWQGRTIIVPADDLIGIEPIAERWQWLSGLAPSSYEHHPVLAPSLRWQADRSAGGEAILCDASPVLHAIGMPAGSTIRYALDGAYSRLVVWPILDDSAGAGGSCTVRILLDGQRVWQGPARAGGLPPALNVNVAGKRELVLQVEAAEGGDVLQRFAWAWPILQR